MSFFSKRNLRKLTPYPVRLLAKRLFPVSRIIKKWKRTDPLNWPVPALINKQGLEKYEYTLFSQNGEDGILRYLFSEIGFRSKSFLEFGFGATENNSLRLMLKEGFRGVFIDGSALTVKNFNKTLQKLGISNVRAINKFLSLDNLEATISESGLPKEIDLLSIDVDGNDYWFWEEIRSISPRIVVIEYNASFGPELSVTIPYDPNFKRFKYHKSGVCSGASICALEKLGRKKGYALVGCDSKGINAFFVRNDSLTPKLNVLSPQSAYRLQRSMLRPGCSLEDRLKIIKDLPLTIIE